MKGSAEVAFDLPETDAEIVLNVEWEHDYDPGCYSGLPENCYPSSEDSSAEIEPEWEAKVMLKYIEWGKEAIASIKKQQQELIDNTVPEWAAEEGRHLAEMAAEQAFEDRRERE